MWDNLPPPKRRTGKTAIVGSEEAWRTTVLVRNLADHVDQDGLVSTFESFGQVERVAVIYHYGVRIALVKMETEEAAIRAIKAINGKMFEGKRLKATKAPPILQEKWITMHRKLRRQCKPFLSQPGHGEHPGGRWAKCYMRGAFFFTALTNVHRT